MIPDPRPTHASGNDHLTRLRDALVMRLFKEDIAELLLIVAQESNKAPFKNEGALLLEIFHELFRGHTPEALVEALERQKKHAEMVASGELPAHAAKKDLEAAVRCEGPPRLDSAALIACGSHPILTLCCGGHARGARWRRPIPALRTTRTVMVRL